jgi:hypothetical protein
MNKRRLAAIARWLEAGAPHKKGVIGFDMKNVGTCGTTCCIAGAAIQFFGTKEEKFAEEQCSDPAWRILDLHWTTANRLFEPPDFDERKYSTAHAARVIRKLIETGVVDWDGTRYARRKKASSQASK